MSKAEKLFQRFLSKPTDFTYDELARLLKVLGYVEAKAGKTSGSRVAFVNHQTKSIIRLHRPHPRPALKRYQMDDIEEALKLAGVIK
jgi:HicA-like toxin of HicAB toxin-antitoxin system